MYRIDYNAQNISSEIKFLCSFISITYYVPMYPMYLTYRVRLLVNETIRKILFPRRAALLIHAVITFHLHQKVTRGWCDGDFL